MSDMPQQDQEQEPDDAPSAEEALKRRLLNRIAIAAVMVVGLLGSLAMFDALVAPEKPTTAKLAALPPQEAPKPAEPVAPAVPAEPIVEAPKDGVPAAPEPGQPVAPAAVTAEAKSEAKPETKPVASPENKAEVKPESKPASKPVPEVTASPGASALQPLPAEKPLTKPATSRQAAVRPSEPVPPAAAPAAKPDPAREIARNVPGTPRRAPASRPITQAAERQFALQMGVFNTLANAEDLRAKLELNGIPSTIEARVHAGPFASREEADAARVKLKELGLDGGLLITMKK